MEDDILKFDNIDKDMLLDVLNSVVWYNGISSFLSEIKDEIEKGIGIDEVGQYTIAGYEDRHDEHIDEQEEIFWMILVLLFGCYGTSPRRGWLYVKNKDGILKFINMLLVE